MFYSFRASATMFRKASRSIAPGTMCLPTMNGGYADVERVGERQVGLESLPDLRGAHVLLKPLDIKSDRTGYFIDRFLGDLTFGCHHCVMKGLVFSLPLGGKSGMRGSD